MTNELEKQFFDTFGIEPKKQCYYWDCPYSTGDVVKDTPMNERDCNSCKNPNKEIYPQITDRILLELICIATRFYGELVLEQCLDVKDLKEQVLNIFIRTSYKDNFKHQVRTLFEEE